MICTPSRYQRRKRTNIYVAVSIIFLILGVAALGVICGMYYATQLAKTQFGIIFDAGSSHTTMYLYEWEGEKVNGTGDVAERLVCEVEGGGLTDYTDMPEEAGSSLTKCLNMAAHNISWASKQFTPVYLGATAGMRLLRLKDVSSAETIMESVKTEVKGSGFQVTDIDQQVKILSGQEEGIGLWVTANFLAGTLGLKLFPSQSQLLPTGTEETIGSMDLGGASTQISFATSENAVAPLKGVVELSLFSRDLTVFSNSYLCFGATEMRNQVLAILTKEAGYQGTVLHPCYVRGAETDMEYSGIFASVCTNSYASSTIVNGTIKVVGVGNNSECENVMAQLFQHSPYFTDLGATVPQRLVGRGALAYAVKDLSWQNPVSQINYTTFVQLMNDWCLSNHSDIMQIDIYDPTTICINTHYIHYLLSKAYKIEEDQWANILFSNKLNGVSLGWSLGYMANLTSAIPHAKLDLYEISLTVFIVVLIISLVLVILAIIAFALACQFRRATYRALQQVNQPF
ncbi:ectonucleoside triphosphate diphosphohydrolase 3-like isoform X2 [Watersipora subatra]|uniref:ectonucleoside triphosphate diphosphohydrolase 3-like isoform X2 n=1 Tax=Watersipora subatra TaxID=2589382 RepID=UPI00355B22F5